MHCRWSERDKDRVALEKAVEVYSVVALSCFCTASMPVVFTVSCRSAFRLLQCKIKMMNSCHFSSKIQFVSCPYCQGIFACACVWAERKAGQWTRDKDSICTCSAQIQKRDRLLSSHGNCTIKVFYVFYNRPVILEQLCRLCPFSNLLVCFNTDI